MSSEFKKDDLIGDEFGVGLDGSIDDKHGMHITMLPRYVVKMNIELLKHHQDILREIQAVIQSSNYDPEVYFGQIAAACGIMLDGVYDQADLAERLYKALVNRRSVIKVTNNNDPRIVTIPGLTTDIIADNLLKDKKEGKGEH